MTPIYVDFVFSINKMQPILLYTLKSLTLMHFYNFMEILADFSSYNCFGGSYIGKNKIRQSN